MAVCRICLDSVRKLFLMSKHKLEKANEKLTGQSFCLICLDTCATKLFPLNNNRLERAYTNVTGLKVRIIRQHINNVPKLCAECAQRLTNCDTFKGKTLRAHSLLIQLLLEKKPITWQSLKSVNRAENLLTSNIVKHTFEPDHCDVYLIHDEEDNNIRNEENIKYNLEEISDTRSVEHDESMYESETDANDYEVEYLSDLDINNDVQVTNNNQKCDTGDLRNARTNSSKDANNKEDAFISRDSDYEVEILESDIDDDTKHDSDNDIDHHIKHVSDNDIDNESDDIDNDVVRSRGGGRYNDFDFDIDIDEDHDIDKLLEDNYSSDRLINKVKVTTENRVSLNNLIFVRDTKPRDIDELSNNNHISERLMNKLKVDYNSENKVSLNNLIFVKDTKPVIQHKDFAAEKDSMYLNQNRVYNGTPCQGKPHVEQTFNKILMQRNQIVKPNNNNSIIKQNKTHEEVKKCNSKTSHYNEHEIINENTDNVKLNNDEIAGVVKDIKDTRNVIQPIIKSNIKNKGNDSKDRKSKTAKSINKKHRVSTSTISKIRELYVRKPKTYGHNEITLKLFTRTSLTYEEQIANIQKRKETEKYKKSPYKCEICFSAFWQLDAYHRHLDKHTSKVGKLECAVCGVHYRKRVVLVQHLLCHSELYSCALCLYTTSSKSYAIGHERWHNGLTFKCQHCGFEFRKRTSLLSHRRIKHPSDSVCPLCGFSFVGVAGVKKHIYLMHRFEDVNNLSGPSCEECNVRFASETAYQQHMAVSPKHAISGSERKRNEPRSERSLYCNYYQKTKRQKLRERPRDLLRRPFRQRLDPRFLCELCGRKFYASITLREHMGLHTGDKMHKCDICHRTFTYKTTFNLHMATHSDNPPLYPCGVCHRTFVYVSNRRRHMKVHQAIRPVHKCQICDKTFTVAFVLEQHVTHVHGNVPWPKRKRRDKLKATTRRSSVDTSDSRDSDEGK